MSRNTASENSETGTQQRPGFSTSSGSDRSLTKSKTATSEGGMFYTAGGSKEEAQLGLSDQNNESTLFLSAKTIILPPSLSSSQSLAVVKQKDPRPDTYSTSPGTESSGYNADISSPEQNPQATPGTDDSMVQLLNKRKSEESVGENIMLLKHNRRTSGDPSKTLFSQDDFKRWVESDVFEHLRARGQAAHEEVEFSADNASADRWLVVILVASLYIMFYVAGGLAYYVLEHNGYVVDYPSYLNTAFVPVVVMCCFMKCRIPRTKQEIEADFHRKKLTQVFRKHLNKVPVEDVGFKLALEKVKTVYEHEEDKRSRGSWDSLAECEELTLRQRLRKLLRSMKSKPQKQQKPDKDGDGSDSNSGDSSGGKGDADGANHSGATNPESDESSHSRTIREETITIDEEDEDA
ncbi:hypothetical protein IscW_ISCW016944 [Ixodes scapularis]|uniref:Uncharacterized protein n=1 Tax=Ixodes scapularis TaxID=6945 RepID=B7PDH7_IXOSC|nr:hypothetical protein IscW_ISCW016944 [Ixodes scapularis]|eukprot:XP_002410811.1 hypothetical protein IscW_ISCW016944 [Ixodes scapularis]